MGFRDGGAEGEVRGLVVIEGEVASFGELGAVVGEGSWERRDAMNVRRDGSEVEVEAGGGIVIGGGSERRTDRAGGLSFDLHWGQLSPFAFVASHVVSYILS